MILKKIPTKLKELFQNHKPVIIIVILLLLTVIIYPVFAKYIEDFIGTGSVSVDKVNYNIELVQSEATIHDKQITYYFNVNNYDENDVLNEVLMKYYIKVMWPLVDIDSDCASKISSCTNESTRETMKKNCPVTCGYANTLNGITFSKKLYYKNSENSWIEIPINIVEHIGYYNGYDNLKFDSKTQHAYKLVITLSDDIYAKTEYDLYVDLEFEQTNI